MKILLDFGHKTVKNRSVKAFEKDGAEGEIHSKPPFRLPPTCFCTIIRTTGTEGHLAKGGTDCQALIPIN
jgi:hypothetical protein